MPKFKKINPASTSTTPEITQPQAKESGKPKRKINPLTGNTLTPKQNRFVAEYIKSNGNGVQSALKSYNTTDYKTADQIAMGNLDNPSIISEIRNSAKELNLTPKKILKRMDSLLDLDDKAVAAAQTICNMAGWFYERNNVNSTLHVHLTGQDALAIMDHVKQAQKTLSHMNQNEKTLSEEPLS